MDPYLYKPLFLAATTLIGYITAARYLVASPSHKMRSGIIIPLAISIFLVFWLGRRPINGGAFGDTANYALEYLTMSASDRVVSMNWHSEWIWSLLMVTCKKMEISVEGFFTIVEAGYILSALWAIKRFMPSNPMLGLLFIVTSLMFFTFGVNGLRNGLACHIILLAMSFLFDDKYVVGGLLCLLALGMHRSVMLPIAAIMAGCFVIKDYKYAVMIWVGAIVLSLLEGEAITNFFAWLDFDDRMTSYVALDDNGAFSSTGFRWDFLLYSSFPILMGWYVCEKKKIRDDWYKALCIAYCLCNAFWVIVIRIAFSNRFAYLSWFMYPIVIAYPLINLPLWEDQNKKTGMILAVYCSFTLFINTFLW